MPTQTWDKCPSVTTSGKPFFYTRLSPYNQRVWVVWDRIQKCWVIEIELISGGTLTATETFDNPKDAMKFVDSLEGK